VLLLSPFTGYSKSVLQSKTKQAFPYAQAGLSKRQAAAHLLSRFTFGIKPGDVDAVTNMGIENWFLQQLNGGLPDDSLNSRLQEYDALHLSNTEIVNQYPLRGQIVRMAIKDGVISKDSVAVNGKKEYRDTLDAYMQQKGYRKEGELFRQLINQKILRAAYTNNQVQEVMADFWFNHFNVAIVKNDCARFILPYERDVIRPNAIGNFGALLLATAQSPAMLYYLDNFTSVAADKNKQAIAVNAPAMSMMGDTLMNKPVPKKKQPKGLNENYAREVMELHTLGVTGGYTQKDVTEAARMLTGWTVYPMGDYNNSLNQQKKMTKDSVKNVGFIHHGDFVFDPARHDEGEKVVLGKKFAANGGYEEGTDLLNMLAHKPATAKFICTKIAVRFVSDDPPKSLVNKMTATFLKKDGDIKAVLLTMVNAPEFWSAKAVRAKTKSPFELAISSVRSLNADVKHPYKLFEQISRMGEKIYYYQAPTGFPDKGQYWINTGSLLNRMNFGLAFAAGRIQGVQPDLRSLSNGHEPESAVAALTTYSKIMMPERNLTATIKQLSPMLNEPDLEQKVTEAANHAAPTENNSGAAMGDETNEHIATKNKDTKQQQQKNENDMMARVAGIIIGSPEFQRR
jgi:uncharacterized protein (DUF1800 family)